MNKDQLRKILASIEVGRLVKIVRWEIQPCAIGWTDGGWIIKCVFERPDRDTKIVEEGKGRGWYIERDATPEQVQRSAFSAVKMLVEHELLEFFKVGGVRLFDPHESRTAHGESFPEHQSALDSAIAISYNK